MKNSKNRGGVIRVPEQDAHDKVIANGTKMVREVSYNDYLCWN